MTKDFLSSFHTTLMPGDVLIRRFDSTSRIITVMIVSDKIAIKVQLNSENTTPNVQIMRDSYGNMCNEWPEKFWVLIRSD